MCSKLCKTRKTLSARLQAHHRAQTKSCNRRDPKSFGRESDLKITQCLSINNSHSSINSKQIANLSTATEQDQFLRGTTTVSKKTNRCKIPTMANTLLFLLCKLSTLISNPECYLKWNRIPVTTRTALFLSFRIVKSKKATILTLIGLRVSVLNLIQLHLDIKVQLPLRKLNLSNKKQCKKFKNSEFRN